MLFDVALDGWTGGSLIAQHQIGLNSGGIGEGHYGVVKLVQYLDLELGRLSADRFLRS